MLSSSRRITSHASTALIVITDMQNTDMQNKEFFQFSVSLEGARQQVGRDRGLPRRWPTVLDL